MFGPYGVSDRKRESGKGAKWKSAGPLTFGYNEAPFPTFPVPLVPPSAIQVNVVELSTECTPAPMSGETLFNATAELHHPLDHAVEDLRDTLDFKRQPQVVLHAIEPRR